ncbi:MAG: efflux RND transporter periplasmic adaptor subunit [Acidobacteriota bacterium]
MVAATACSKEAAAPSSPAADGRGAAGGGGRAGGRGGRGGGGPVPVTVTTAAEKPMAVNVRVVGNVEAASTVGIRAQVTGALRTVHFKEGDEVTAGQLLFTLDPRPFDLAVKQAEVTLARDTSQSKNADAQLARSVEMLAKGLVAPATHEATLAQANALKGQLAADQVAIDNAKLQLQYTKITAPVSGRTGALLVYAGALVRNNDTAPLVVINQVSPVFVSFAVPARLLDQVRGERAHQGLRVLATPAGTSDPAASGTVTFLDNAVDVTTDTIRMKATFANRDRRLWPGAFVDVTLRLSENPKAIVVPNAAVQASQQGQLVYVVKADQTVEARPIKVAWTEGDETVIASGLTVGETVVTDGQLRLTPGAKITTGGRGQGRADQPAPQAAQRGQ